MEAYKKLAKSMEEWVLDCHIEWPEQIEDITDLIDLENEITFVIDDYDFNEMQMILMVQIMCYEQKTALFKDSEDKFDYEGIPLAFKNFIYYRVPDILARYIAKETYVENDYLKTLSF